MKCIRSIFILIFFSEILFSTAVFADETIRIGVLSHRGTETTYKMWSPTANYLTESIRGYQFEIVPLDFDRVHPTVADGAVDFILVNSGIYVSLEVSYRVSRIATLNNLVNNQTQNIFGSVIFARADRKDLNDLGDLVGKKFMAVDETSLGGYQMAWRKFKQQGYEIEHDLGEITFGKTHDNVVMAVLNGEVDAGNVRTNILERMASEGSIMINRFKIISQELNDGFPLLHSTQLYPEWPFSKVQHTSNELAQQVAVALLNMPTNHGAAKSGRYAGWTIPLDYQPVHELFQELSLPPYQKAKFTIFDVFKKYFYAFILGIVIVLFMGTMTYWVFRLNKELSRSKIKLERQYELILNSVADGIYGVDKEGNSTFVNRAMENITGWDADEVIGKNQHTILHHTKADGSHFPADECPVYATSRDSVSRFVDDDIFWRKDGTSFPVEYASSPLRDDRGDVIGSVVVFRDISERKQAAESEHQHQIELAHMARLNTMGEMASGIAHEINQPLTAIATNAHACMRLIDSGGDNQERISDIVEKISVQAERAGQVIRQLRQFVRKETPEMVPININTIIEEIVVLIKPEARKANVTIDLDLMQGLDDVAVQHIQIQQVILNLANNAIEAMSEHTSSERLLTIKTAKAGKNAITVTVADTGPGISEEVKDHFFDPFITTKEKGMGLGLSISQGIIDLHMGNLYLESSPKGGAVFRFTLPIVNKGDELS
jgi:PAS domain S-box-containing protein